MTMMQQLCSLHIVLCCFVALIATKTIDAFQAPLPTRSLGSISTTAPLPFSRQTPLFAASENEPSKKRRKRKRKQLEASGAPVASEATTKATATPEPRAPTTPAVELKPQDDTPVQLEVKNIMKKEEVEPEPSAIANFMSSMSKKSGQQSPPASPTTPMASSTAASDDTLDNSLEQLLQDAKQMKEEQSESSGEGGLLSDEEGTGIKEIIRNVLSTIVTADFFVVCAFLIWFLAGIFWRAAFNDDSVQIAFNNNFETLVQPALGVLMIAALAGNFFQEDEVVH